MGCNSSKYGATIHSHKSFNGFWVRRSDGEELLIDGKMLRSKHSGWYAKIHFHNDKCSVVMDEDAAPVELGLRNRHSQLFGLHDPHNPEYIFDRRGLQNITEVEFVNDEKLEASIRNGDFALIRGSYFEKCCRKQTRIGLRQHISDSDQWSGPEAVQLWRKYGRLFVVIISYAWLSAKHPDPKLFHLPRIARAVQELKAHAAMYGLTDIAVAIDYCSLWQLGLIGNDELQRTEKRVEQFKCGFDSFNCLYIHPDVTAVKLTATPSGESRAYDDRGWPLLESIIIDAKSGHRSNRLCFGPDFYPEKVSCHGSEFIKMFSTFTEKRQPPLTPSQFEKELQSRAERANQRGLPLFTNASDYQVLPGKYAQLIDCARFEHVLAFDNCKWGDAEVRKLCEWLSTAHIHTLKLRCNDITDAAMEPLVSAVLSMRTLKYLMLDHNQIGETGAEQLARLVNDSSSLKSLDIKSNPLCKCPEAVEKIYCAWRAARKNIGRNAIDHELPKESHLKAESYRKAITGSSNGFGDNTTDASSTASAKSSIGLEGVMHAKVMARGLPARSDSAGLKYES